MTTKKRKSEAAVDEEVDAAERKRLKKARKAAEENSSLAEAAVDEAVDAAERKRLKKARRAAEENGGLEEATAEIDAEASEAAERKRLRKQKKAELRAAEAAEAEAQAAAEALAEKKRLRKERKTAARAVEAEVKAQAAAEEAVTVRKSMKSGEEAARRAAGDDAESQTIQKGNSHEDSDSDTLVKKSAAASEDKCFTAFIGGLPSHVDEAQLKRDFSECGDIKNIILSRWPEDGSSKGIAFVTFATESGLNNCIEWNGEYYERKMIRIEKKSSQDKDPRKKIDMGKGGQRLGYKPEGCMSVAVLDMSLEVTEDDLWSFFEQCGKISAVKILKHRETYESRGIAFVTFEDTRDADNAVRLSVKKIRDKQVRIEYAAPKNDVKGKGKGKKGVDPQEKPEGCTSVVVRNLSVNAAEDDLWRLFKSCSSVSNVSILFDRDTWLSKGVAFVDFDDTADLDVAVKLSGAEVRGQAVSISFKMPKW
mmetsp:Transcript_102667/g.187561  ORF Transcript_102667/g.187561 Transcript_102667/m.187561 type:complete len:480 (-) Transcript_102667:3-1442(-)